MNTIHCPLADAAAMSRHETAFVSGEHLMVFFELDEMAARVARNLKRAGAQPGDRVAIFLESSWQAVAILFGCWRAGAPPTSSCGRATGRFGRPSWPGGWSTTGARFDSRPGLALK